MDNFISYLYVDTNNLSEEKVCVGVFLKTPNNLFFDFSSKKLRAASGFVNSNVYNNLYNSLTILKNEVDSEYTENNQVSFMELMNEDRYNYAYFNYLSNYAKGLLNFSKPKEVSKAISHDEYKKLFSRIVGEEILEKKKILTFKTKVNDYLKKEAFNKVDKRFKVSPEIINTLYATHTIDFIGKNGALLAGNTIDFHAAPATIDKNLFEFKRIVEGLKELSKIHDLPKGTYSVYFENPDDADSKKVLDNALKDSDRGYNILELDSLEITANTISKGEYGKFSDFLNKSL